MLSMAWTQVWDYYAHHLIIKPQMSNKTDTSNNRTMKSTSIGDCPSLGAAFGTFQRRSLAYNLPLSNDPLAIDSMDVSRLMARKTPSPELDMNVSSPRFNSPVNLPRNDEFSASQRRVLVDVTLLTGNKHYRNDDSSHSNKTSCSMLLESPVDDSSERPAKRHCRNDSTSTIGSMDAALCCDFAMENSTTNSLLLPAPTPDFTFHPIPESENASFPCT